MTVFPTASKQCPDCLKEHKGPLPLDPVYWYFHSRTRPDGTTTLEPGGYCKTHANRRTNVARRTRRRAARSGTPLPERGATVICAMCRLPTRTWRLATPDDFPSPRHLPPLPATYELHGECYKILSSSRLDLARVRTLYATQRAEIKAEDEAESAWRGDRRRRPHVGNRLAPMWGSHAYCLERERDLKNLLLFLLRIERDRLNAD